jgi:hypothetical protein
MAAKDKTTDNGIAQSEGITTDAVTVELGTNPDETDPKVSLKTDYQRVDPEVAKYASETAIHVDDATNLRLKKMIDKRVLVIMMVTYFLQAIDKSTVSFAAIMGIREDTSLQGPQYSWLTTIVYIAVLVVEYPTNW